MASGENSFSAAKKHAFSRPCNDLRFPRNAAFQRKSPAGDLFRRGETDFAPLRRPKLPPENQAGVPRRRTGRKGDRHSLRTRSAGQSAGTQLGRSPGPPGRSSRTNERRGCVAPPQCDNIPNNNTQPRGAASWPARPTNARPWDTGTRISHRRPTTWPWPATPGPQPRAQRLRPRSTIRPNRRQFALTDGIPNRRPT